MKLEKISKIYRQLEKIPNIQSNPKHKEQYCMDYYFRLSIYYRAIVYRFGEKEINKSIFNRVISCNP